MLSDKERWHHYIDENRHNWWKERVGMPSSLCHAIAELTQNSRSRVRFYSDGFYRLTSTIQRDFYGLFCILPLRPNVGISGYPGQKSYVKDVDRWLVKLCKGKKTVIKRKQHYLFVEEKKTPDGLFVVHDPTSKKGNLLLHSTYFVSLINEPPVGSRANVEFLNFNDTHQVFVVAAHIEPGEELFCLYYGSGSHRTNHDYEVGDPPLKKDTVWETNHCG
jgi:hypothetical protein